jgi:Mg-chelatase subunit ChlD
MTWLFPLYLLGAGAIALPILLHLRRREPKEKVVFSSLMFLERSPQLLTQRSKLERWLLLALRCLALVLLALMFSRPFLPMARESALADSGESVLLLLDGSASMRRGDLWRQAIDAAEARIKGLKAKDKISVMRFDRETRTLWSFDRDVKESASRKAQLSAILKGERASWGATDLGKALMEAAGAFASSESIGRSAAPRRIVLISDLQDGARLDALRGFAWPDDVEVELAQLAFPNADNLTLSLAASETESDGAIEKNTSAKSVGGVRVRVSNVRDSRLDKFSLTWENGNSDPIEGYLPSGASRVLRTPPEPGKAGGDVLVLKGDTWDFDNRIYVAPPQPRKVRVVYRGPEGVAATEASAPLFYLKRALQPTSSLMPVLEPGAEWQGASLALIQSESLTAADSPGLKRWLNEGGLGVVIASKGQDASLINEWVGASSLAISEATVDEYAMLGEVNAEHPLLSPFADARLRDFTKIRFWHHRKISWNGDEARKPEVLASFDNGDPAMLLWQVGKGRLLLMASGWQPSDSQLALSTKFVPMLFGWLEAAGFSHEAARSMTVGDEWDSTDAVESIRKPDGTLVEKPDENFRFDQPGFYSTKQATETRIVSVNVAPEEGRVYPMAPQKLSEAGVKLASSSNGDRATVNVADQKNQDTQENEARQKAWFWVLLLLLGVLAWETWLAGQKPRIETLNA